MWNKDSSISRGCNKVFIPFVKLAESGANILTNLAFDPFAKIPEHKVCAVRRELSSGRPHTHRYNLSRRLSPTRFP